MVVTQRRARLDPNSGSSIEGGIKATCDGCGVDVTHTVRIKCAAKGCEEIDICPNCFCEGKEFQRHKAWHDYKVVEQHSWPIFTDDWGADEELLLISGLIVHGLGNWIEVASHVGTRTKEECERHYEEVYLGVGPDGKDLDEDDDAQNVEMETGKRKREFMPPMNRSFEVDPDEFQSQKKARIEELRKPHAITSNAALMVSAPTNHEIAGFMPGRLEFEHEVENDAELAVKDLEFLSVLAYGGDEQPEATRPVEAPDSDSDSKDTPKEEEVKVKQEPRDDDQPEASGSRSGGSRSRSPSKSSIKGKQKADPQDVEAEDELEIKLALLDIYASKLDKREEAKDLIFDRCLTEHKRITAAERKRPKDERELIQRYKVFAKLQTAQDYETLIEGVVFEHNLRRRITELQEYRRMGITTGAEAEFYDNAKAARAGYRPMPPRDRVPELLTGARSNAGQHRFLHGAYGTPPPGSDMRKNSESRDTPIRVVPALANRKPPTPLNLSNAASLDLLSTEEQSLCSSLRVLPKPYLTIKEMYIRENERRKGLLKRRDARRMMKIDVNKSGRIFDFLVSAGMLILAYDPSVKVFAPGKEGLLGAIGYGLGGVELMDSQHMAVDVGPLTNGDGG